MPDETKIAEEPVVAPTEEKTSVEKQPVVEEPSVVVPEIEPVATEEKEVIIEKGEPLINSNPGAPDDDGGKHYNQIVQS